MRWAWRRHRQHAWGKDEIKPISGGFESFPLKNHHLGLSLDRGARHVVGDGPRRRVQRRRRWVKAQSRLRCRRRSVGVRNLIRLVGGLLSAWHACGDPVLLAKARDLADRLLPSFAASPLGIPHRFINLRTGAFAARKPTRPRPAPSFPNSASSAARPATTATAPRRSARWSRCSNGARRSACSPTRWIA